MDVDGDYVRFVREHTSALLRTAYLLTGDRAAAEELVQDVLVRLYPKWHLVRSAEHPLAYVRRSVANAFVNQIRRSSRRELAVEFLPERADGHDAAGQLDDRSALWDLLAELPERQRAAVVLRYFHDLPDDEIAAALGCRVGTVRSLVSRALAELREHVREVSA